MAVLDTAWLSKCAMERIIVHWTAGAYDISANDRSHYHFLIDHYGEGWKGDHPVSGNARDNPSGPVTSHVKNLNTGSIGISVAAMGNAVENPFDAGPWPITTIQWLALCEALAELCRFYSLPVEDETVLMHGEVQEVLGVVQDGKWDIGRLPFTDVYENSREVGEHMRETVRQLMQGASPRPVKPSAAPRVVNITLHIEVTPAGAASVTVAGVEGVNQGRSTT